MVNKRYGWKPDLPDQRDLRFVPEFGPLESAPLPPAVDLRSQCPAVYDQGQLGSCTANAIAAAFEFDLRKRKLPDFMPSRLFVYYNERAMEGTIEQDAGAAIRDGIKTLNVDGAAPESLWPYDISKFSVKPSDESFAAAKKNLALQYRRVNNKSLHNILAALAKGLPVVFGFTVYESFESGAVSRSGIVPMPAAGEKVLGGHAVLCVGYDMDRQVFFVRNSWGPAWGISGYCEFPFAYLTSDMLADDFWVVEHVEET